MPNIYNIPPSLPFLDSLAVGILKKYGHDPLVFSGITIFLPSRRSCTALQEAFLRANKGTPILLPQILALGGVDDENNLFKITNGDTKQLPNLISPIEQRLILTELIEKWQSRFNKTGEKITTPQAAHLAIELASFLGDIEKEQLSFENINEIVPDDFSQHWQITLEFLSILIENWPKILSERNAFDIHTQRNIILKQQSEQWKECPPDYPVIAAGSTGSIPATADLLKTIANLQEGCIILPGLDMSIDNTSWQNIHETHYQYGIKQLLENLDVKICDVKNWNNLQPKDNKEYLISEIMRPFETTDAWVSLKKISGDSLKGLEIITAPNMQEEASLIALKMKETLQQQGKTVALITHQRDLARRVSAILKKWDIVINDSAGSALSNMPQSVFLRLLARMATDQASDPVSLLNLLKHPFAACGYHLKEFRDNVRILELKTLRGIRASDGIDEIYLILEEKNETALLKWLKDINNTIQPVLKLMSLGSVPFSEILLKHIEAAEKLSATNDETGSDRLWRGNSGEQLKDFLDELILSAKNFKKIDPIDYPGLLDALLAGQTYRPPYGTHPRLSILSPIEARMLSFDLVIMGGLNEGSWPASSKADPWMSRPMRSDFGLPLPEKKIGQSAHDFAQLFCSPTVTITRCEKLDGMQTIPSRWLLRLDAVLKILKLENEVKPSRPWLAWAKILNRPDVVSAIVPPSPTPAKSARPNKLSVTAIEKLMRDPYSIYAAKILKLRALDPIDKEPGAAEFGNFVHNSLEIFTNKYDSITDGNYYECLLECGREILQGQNIKPTIISFWWPRFERIAAWFVDNEKRRRRDGVAVFSEIKGEYIIDFGDFSFTIEARADRVETDAAGNISLIDFKTGTIPTRTDITLGLSPQMTLEGVIANNNGFAHYNGVTSEIFYWRLSGGEKPVEEKPVKLDNLIADAEEGLRELIEIFAKEDTAYLACPNPDKAPRYNDYEHLERRSEWE